MNEVLLAKAGTIQRCVQRAREEHAAAGANFEKDYTHQDAAILNVLRACDAAIDLANVVIREEQLGLPQSSSESFELLVRAGVIDLELGRLLCRMVGFRNVAVHEYRKLDLGIADSVIRERLDDLLLFSRLMIQRDGTDPTP